MYRRYTSFDQFFRRTGASLSHHRLAATITDPVLLQELVSENLTPEEMEIVATAWEKGPKRIRLTKDQLMEHLHKTLEKKEKQDRKSKATKVTEEFLRSHGLTKDEFDWALEVWSKGTEDEKPKLEELIKGIMRARQTGFKPHTELKIWKALFKRFEGKDVPTVEQQLARKNPPKVPIDQSYAQALAQALEDNANGLQEQGVFDVEGHPEKRVTYDTDSPLTKQKRGLEDMVGDTGLKNILAVLEEASSEETEFFKDWYTIVHHQARDIARESGRPLEEVAAVIAILSPGSLWEANIKAARRLCLGKGIAGTGGFYPINVYKALRVLHTGDYAFPFRDKPRKITPFFETLVSPEAALNKAVVDRHMFAIWYGDANINVDGISDPIYAKIQDDVRRAAQISGLSTQGVQAVTWVLWRNRAEGKKHERKPRPEGEALPAWIPRQRELFFEDWKRQKGLEPMEEPEMEEEPMAPPVPPEQTSFRFTGHRRRR